MIGNIPRGARWLVARTTSSPLADDVIGEMTERWRAHEGPRVAAAARAYQLRAFRRLACHARSLPPARTTTSVVHPVWPIRHDLRLAWRRWAGRPVLALTAILILALGIGATTSIFSIVDAVLLRPLPWKDPNRLVTLYVVRPEWRTNPVLANSWNTGNISWTILKDLQQRSNAFEAFGAWQSDRPTLNGTQNELVRTLQVTSSVLPMLGVSPVRGRFFTPDEDDVSTTNVLVSHEAWQRRFGGRDDILGLAVSLNEKPFSIVGVLPPGFRFGITEPVEFVLPMGRVPERDRHENNYFMNSVARLAPGVTIDQARQQVDSLVAGTEGLDKQRARITLFDEDRRADSRRPLLLLLAGAALLLVIAASNVAALLLGDASSRRQEIAVRVALGGARWQVARQLFSEGLLLAIGAAVAGLVIALVLTPVLVSIAPEALPVFGDIRIDARVFAFALGLTMVTLLFFGVAPSMLMSSADPADAMRESGRDPGARRTRGYRWIVACQVAL
jgi:putative ABC transport system permease protein